MNMKDERVVVWYHSNFGRNDGPPLYWFNALKRYFDFKEVLHLMPDGDTARFGKFDYHFWIDYGEDGLPTDKNWKIPQDGGTTIYVCSDAHIDDKGRDYRFNKAREFDYAFFNQERFVSEYRKFVGSDHKNKDIGFLPHAAEPMAYPHFEIIKKYDVSFIGHVQDVKNYNGFSRVEFLDRMFREFPNFYFGTRNPIKPEKNMFEDASKTFCMSKVVLNISIKDDINMRFFEILSSGAFQLVNWIPTIELMGRDGVDFVTYKTLDEAVEKAKYYIEHDDEREKIAQAGHKMFMDNHRYQDRIEGVLNFIKED